MLDNASLPAGTTATITGFTVSGSSTVHAPGAPISLTSPTTGTLVGTLVVNPDGTYTFTPAPDYVGAVPAIQTNVRSSDGQTVTSALTITVLPSELGAGHGTRALVWVTNGRCNSAQICTPCLFLRAYCLTVLVHLPLCAVEPLDTPPTSDVTSPGVPATGSVLDDVTVPPGETATVTGFLLPGSTKPVPAGSAPVPVVDPVTGVTSGTLTVAPDGTYVFVPAPGFTGPAPPVTVIVASSDGQVDEAPLTMRVTPVLVDDDEAVNVTEGRGPVSTNLLTNAEPSSGATLRVASFTPAGSNVTYPAGPAPVPVKDPTTGATTGTIVVLANGTAVFTPSTGYAGQVPPIAYTVASSDGTTDQSTLTITVLPGKCGLPCACRAHLHSCLMCSCSRGCRLAMPLTTRRTRP